MDFGERLKELRTRSNFSQKELSEITGLTVRTIQRIENNDVKPSLHSLKLLGEALRTDFSALDKQHETKPHGIKITITVTDMNQLIIDLKVLFKNNWKIIVLIAIVVYLLSNYTEIKSGIFDGWNRI